MKGKGTRLMQLVNVVVSSSKLLSDQKTSDCQIMRIMRAPCRRDKRIIALRSLKELSCSHLDMMLVVGVGRLVGATTRAKLEVTGGNECEIISG